MESHITLLTNSPRVGAQLSSKSVLHSSSSKNLLLLNALANPADWTSKVLDQEMKELEKLETILAYERQRASER
jgi:hypothetical protein